jgi:hypothetical protein
MCTSASSCPAEESHAHPHRLLYDAAATAFMLVLCLVSCRYVYERHMSCWDATYLDMLASRCCCCRCLCCLLLSRETPAGMCTSASRCLTEEPHAHPHRPLYDAASTACAACIASCSLQVCVRAPHAAWQAHVIFGCLHVIRRLPYAAAAVSAAGCCHAKHLQVCVRAAHVAVRTATCNPHATLSHMQPTCTPQALV